MAHLKTIIYNNNKKALIIGDTGAQNLKPNTYYKKMRVLKKERKLIALATEKILRRIFVIINYIHRK